MRTISILNRGMITEGRGAQPRLWYIYLMCREEVLLFNLRKKKGKEASCSIIIILAAKQWPGNMWID